jgi:RNA polymerase sigma factor (TIGR02999 family)
MLFDRGPMFAYRGGPFRFRVASPGITLARMAEVTVLLDAAAAGDRQAAADLMPLVYDELRQLAADRLSAEPSGNTLQPTALVHEAYLRLVGAPEGDRWNHRGHFFAAAAEAIRRILVENARRKKRHKHGGDRRRLSLDATEPFVSEVEDLPALDEALTRLAAHDPIKAEVVKLRFFAGLTMPEIARSLDLSLATVERYWTYARLWLYADLTGAERRQRS